MKKAFKPSAMEGEVLPSDAPLLETPAGRENDFGAADENTITQDEIERPETTSRPRSQTTGRHDEGSGANETVDGLDEIQEAVRHGAEDIPASERGDDFEKLPPPSEEEEDLLDLAAHAARTSRLACQIILTEEMESLTVRIPPGATNWMGR